MSYGFGCLGVFSNKIALIIHDFSAAITFGPVPANLSFEFHFAFRKALTHKRLSSWYGLAVVHLIFGSINLLLISLGWVGPSIICFLLQMVFMGLDSEPTRDVEA